MTRDEALEEAENQLRQADIAADSIHGSADRADARTRIARGYLELARALDKH